MTEKNTAILNQMAKERCEAVGFGRFLNNERVTIPAIIKSSIKQVNELAEGRHVLVINDTTEFNYQKHINFLDKEDEHLGPTGNNKDIGFFFHPGFVIDSDRNIGLGFSYVKIWNRSFDKLDKHQRKYQSLPIHEKESYRWIECGLESKKNLSLAKQITLVADRESDIYEEFVMVPDKQTHLLIRSCKNRLLYDVKDGLYEYVSSSELKGTYSIKIKSDKKTNRTPRKAEIEVRYTKVKIARPKNNPDKKLPAYIELYAVEAKENPAKVPNGEKPIRWFLLTTHTINTIEEALQIIKWYGMRWHIEMLFASMKTKGLNIEASEIESGKGLKVLCLMVMMVALKINQLRLAREDTTGIPANICFTKEEQQVIKLLVKQKTKGKTKKQQCPYKQDTLAWAAWLIARLGGWKGYNSEAKPGIKTMAIGLKEFEAITVGWQLFKEMCV
jgi:hypothetical protein